MVLAKSRREGTMLGRRKARGRKPKDVTAATTSSEPKDAPTARDEAAADTTKLTDLRTRAERLDCCIRKRGDEFHLISRDGSEIGCGSIAALNWELDVLEVELIAGTLKLDDERVGLVLEKLGADRFFAALQHAPALRAAIELRVLGSTPPSPRSQSATRTPRISCAGGSGLCEPAKQIYALGQLNVGRRQAYEYLEILRTMPGCEKAYLVSTGPGFGTRESRHINAVEQLEWQDVGEGRERSDTVALGAWGVEWHDRKTFGSRRPGWSGQARPCGAGGRASRLDPM